MSIEELKQLLIDDLQLDAAFFVGGFGGAMIEKEQIKNATPEELIEIAKSHGYDVVIEEEGKQKKKEF